MLVVSSAHEDLTAEQRAEIEDVAKRLGIEAVRCSMGETDTSDGYQDRKSTRLNSSH